MSDLSDGVIKLPKIPNSQRLIRDASRRGLTYAVQIKDGPIVISVVAINVTVAGGLSPARIKEQLQVKAINYCQQRWPNRLLQIIVAGQIDHTIT